MPHSIDISVDVGPPLDELAKEGAYTIFTNHHGSFYAELRACCTSAGNLAVVVDTENLRLSYGSEECSSSVDSALLDAVLQDHYRYQETLRKELLQQHAARNDLQVYLAAVKNFFDRFPLADFFGWRNGKERKEDLRDFFCFSSFRNLDERYNRVGENLRSYRAFWHAFDTGHRFFAELSKRFPEDAEEYAVLAQLLTSVDTIRYTYTGFIRNEMAYLRDVKK